jgi:hypothetical protein
MLQGGSASRPVTKECYLTIVYYARQKSPFRDTGALIFRKDFKSIHMSSIDFFRSRFMAKFKMAIDKKKEKLVFLQYPFSSSLICPLFFFLVLNLNVMFWLSFRLILQRIIRRYKSQKDKIHWDSPVTAEREMAQPLKARLTTKICPFKVSSTFVDGGFTLSFFFFLCLYSSLI